MSRVFISYRRAEEDGIAHRIHDHLARELGADQVFMDKSGIGPGQVFRDTIARELERCQVMVVVIGKAWQGVQTEKGTSRLHEPNDFVRLEIEGALRRGVQVIPVLIDPMRMPTREVLPDSLKPLVDIQHQVLHLNEYFVFDMGRIVEAIRSGVSAEMTGAMVRVPARSPWRRTALWALLLVSGAGLAYWLVSRPSSRVDAYWFYHLSADGGDVKSVDEQTYDAKLVNGIWCQDLTDTIIPRRRFNFDTRRNAIQEERFNVITDAFEPNYMFNYDNSILKSQVWYSEGRIFGTLNISAKPAFQIERGINVREPLISGDGDTLRFPTDTTDFLWSDGRVTRMTVLKRGKRRSTIPEYRADGLPSGAKSYDNRDSLIETTAYEYLQFDDHGNWTKRVIYTPGESTGFLEVREIDYF